jgi:hypothetical protein
MNINLEVNNFGPDLQTTYCTIATFLWIQNRFTVLGKHLTFLARNILVRYDVFCTNRYKFNSFVAQHIRTDGTISFVLTGTRLLK